MHDFEILYEIDSKSWNENLLKNEYSTFFQTSHHLKKSSEAYPVFINIYDEKKIVVGQLGLKIVNTAEFYAGPFLLKILKLIKNFTRRAIWIYGPIIHSNDPKKREEILQCLMKALEVVLKSNKVVFLYGYSVFRDPLIDEHFVKLFEKNNFQTTDYVTFLADLSLELDDIWKKLHHSATDDIRRAKKRSITIAELSSKNQLDEFVNLHKKWGETKGLPVNYSTDELESLWENIGNNTEKIFFAFYGEKIISAIRISIFNNVAHANFIINSYDKKTSLGGPMLTWNTLEWAKENNLKFYDFTGGSNPKDSKNSDSSLVYYKKKWGGNQIPYYQFYKVVDTKKFFIYKILMNFQTIIRKKKIRLRPTN